MPPNRGAALSICRDGLHTGWTEGRVAAGLGRIEGGIEVLAKVRGGPAARDGLRHGLSLVSLELSLLYAGQGRTDQVKNLARHMMPIFKAQDVHREALAALTVFRRAAEQERVTEGLAREVLSYLRKVRYNPELRFESIGT